MRKKATTTTEAVVTEQEASVAPEQASSKKGASHKKGSPKAKRGVKETKPTAKKNEKPKAAQPREGSKKALVLELLRRENGATLAEIMKATDWQAHSVRGFIAGGLKKAGYLVESTKSEAGERTYRLAQ